MVATLHINVMNGTIFKAYRLEPLVHNQYSFVKPLKLYSALDPRSQKNYDFLPPEVRLFSLFLGNICTYTFRAAEG